MDPVVQGDLIMQNKANFSRAQMNASLFGKKDYEKGPRGGLRKNKPNLSTRLKTGQSQSFDDSTALTAGLVRLRSPQVAQDRSSDYPCLFELAVYNLVLHDGNVMHSMPNGRNFDGEYMKWQMHRRQMR